MRYTMALFCIAAGTFTLIAGTRRDSTQQAAQKVKIVIAHRGCSAHAPENTLASFRQAITSGATATEIDVRTTRDGQLICLHDRDVGRTTNGKGLASDMTLGQLRKLDAGSWFNAKFREERIPTLREALELCRGKIDVLLDLQERGDTYIQRIAAEVRKFGDPKRTILGVRTLDQAKLFRKLLPEARQLALIPNQKSIDDFAQAGVDVIRIWPRWLTDTSLVPRVRKHKLGLHLNGSTGAEDEVRKLLEHHPESLSSDDPARLVQTLMELAGKAKRP